LLTIDNEVKLGDLGLGKFIGGSNAFSLALAYMSPEQFACFSDPTADIW